jgi:hypothetical protein
MTNIEMLVFFPRSGESSHHHCGFARKQTAIKGSNCCCFAPQPHLPFSWQINREYILATSNCNSFFPSLTIMATTLKQSLIWRELAQINEKTSQIKYKMSRRNSFASPDSSPESSPNGSRIGAPADREALQSRMKSLTNTKKLLKHLLASEYQRERTNSF